jgi:hypothetical protein
MAEPQETPKDDAGGWSYCGAACQQSVICIALLAFGTNTVTIGTDTFVHTSPHFALNKPS